MIGLVLPASALVNSTCCCKGGTITGLRSFSSGFFASDSFDGSSSNFSIMSAKALMNSAALIFEVLISYVQHTIDCVMANNIYLVLDK